MKKINEPWNSNLMDAEIKFSDIKLVTGGVIFPGHNFNDSHALWKLQKY